MAFNLPDGNARGLGRAVALMALLALAGNGFAGLCINGTTCDWDCIGRFVLPGETLDCAIVDTALTCGWAAASGTVEDLGERQFRWFAPVESGLYPVTVVIGERVVTVNAFVLIPYDSLQNGELRGFRIGRYPASNPFPNFVVPKGFVEVTEENADTPVSRGLVLRDFVPRYPGGFPSYLALREEILVKLELLADLANERGYPCDKLTVMSGYRTPAFQNRGGGGTNSAHVYGGAADIYLDADNDGVMDDLNGDGAHDSRDARVLAGLVDELERRRPDLVGGCGWYRATRSRGAFIHVDVRGERTRWHQ